RFRFRLLRARADAHPYRSVALATVLGLSGLHLHLLAKLGNLISPDWARSALSALSTLWSSDGVEPILGSLAEARPLVFLTALFHSLVKTPEHFVDAAAVAGLLAGSWLLVMHGFRAFPESPSVLLESLAARARLSVAKKQPGFRQRFQRNF